MIKKVLSGVLGLVLSVSLFLPTADAVTERPYPIMRPAQEIGTYNSTYKVKIYPFDIKKLTSDLDDPYYYDFRNGKPIEELLKPNPPLYNDSNGFPMIKMGDKYYYHPVRTAQYALYYIHAYKQLGKSAYLAQAEKLAAHLVTLSVSPDQSLYFAYKFPYSVQGKETISNPWYSAMSQGQGLSVFVRLYEITKDPKYLDWANRTFRSFLKIARTLPGSKPWVTASDGHLYLWLEEYPTESTRHIHVLNGKIFAMYGLYDYYKLTNNLPAKYLLQGSLTTILAYGDRYRLPNNYSYYSLKNTNSAGTTYHNIHIRQLKQLYKITGDKRFLDMSNRFYYDTDQFMTSAMKIYSTNTDTRFTEQEIRTLLTQ